MNDQTEINLQQQSIPKLQELPVREPLTNLLVSAIWILSDEPDALNSLERYINALLALPIRCELIVVVNGIVDAVPDALRLLSASPLTSHVAQIHRVCDESTAIRAGLDCSRGDLIVLLPAYVQSDPAAIIDMVAELNRGAHYVATWRNPRVDSKWGSLKSRLFNRITSHMTGASLHDINSGLRLMVRDVANHLPIYGDLHRFFPILAALQGFVVSEVKVRHLAERRGEKGGIRMGVYLRRTLDLLTLFFLFKFTKKPLRFFGLIGTACLVAGTIVIAWLSVQRFLGVAMSDRPALLLGIVLVVLGVQLFSVGLLGELMIFTHGRHLFHQHVSEIKPSADMIPNSDRHVGQSSYERWPNAS